MPSAVWLPTISVVFLIVMLTVLQQADASVGGLVARNESGGDDCKQLQP